MVQSYASAYFWNFSWNGDQLLLPSYVKLCGSFSSFSFFWHSGSMTCIFHNWIFSGQKQGLIRTKIFLISFHVEIKWGRLLVFDEKMLSATFSKFYLLSTHFSCLHFNYIRNTKTTGKTTLGVCQLCSSQLSTKFSSADFCNKQLMSVIDLLTIHDFNTHLRITPLC